MFYGMLNLSFWGYIIITLVLTHITIAAVTIFLHRHQAHRALELHPAVSHFFRAWLWLTTGMETKAWTAIHRKHHAKCETTEDPHSPQILGLPKVLWEGAELYRKEAQNEETKERYGQGTPNDWLERNLYEKHSTWGFRLLLLINVILFGIPGITVWAIQMAWIPFFAAGVVNGVGHFFGYRNFECPDAATNIVPWGIIIGGEELHNNHHSYPTSAKLSVKWWEFDIGWFYIRLFETLGLAKVKRIAPTPKIIPGKAQIDAETLVAIITNQIQVMTAYSKKVLLPLFNQEKEKALPLDKNLLSKVGKALVQNELLVDKNGQQCLEQFLNSNTAIQEVYTFRKQLQAIWNKTAASQKELLEALHDWCARAEASGIKLLQDFVAYLKGYTLQCRTA